MAPAHSLSACSFSSSFASPLKALFSFSVLLPLFFPFSRRQQRTAVARIRRRAPPNPRALTTCACCCASLVCALLCAVAYEHAWRASETFPETGSALLRGSSLHFPRPNVWAGCLKLLLTFA